MGKYLDLLRAAEKAQSSVGSSENRTDSVEEFLSPELYELNELSPICLFCRQPVERGTPDTGALAGKDLHLDCYRKRYPDGHPLKKEN